VTGNNTGRTPLRAASAITLPISLPGFMRCSNKMAAYPTLSLDTSVLVLFILVGCTANQLIAPTATPSSRISFSCTILLSTSCLYLQHKDCLVTGHTKAYTVALNTQTLYLQGFDFTKNSNLNFLFPIKVKVKVHRFICIGFEPLRSRCT